MSDKYATVVLGGGLAGLSALWHLQQAGHCDSHLFEKESRVGGLTRSEQLNGFTFDYTGHLLHFKNEKVKQLVSRLLDGNLHSVTRNSWIFSRASIHAILFKPTSTACRLMSSKNALWVLSRHATTALPGLPTKEGPDDFCRMD
jgi:protoporphyrinogen oxidase